ncbi:WD repeat-containing protein 18-like [Polyodon spathula]|uniref:WD repeat-containing protein 18-like n=1 Tax=Polyodon spathula TaxID=7913 RepID=UPI001B7F2C67|nr:WD repeat-containing protein 18-like [Polyodon spathula]
MVYSKAVVPAGALSAITLKAAARSLSLSPGQTAVLDCSIERDSGELVSWYKQSPGDAPQFVLNHYHTNSSAARYGSRFSSERFTARAKDPLTYQLLWEISSGEILLSVLFDVGIMSVTFDPCEYSMFCGGSDGNIFQVALCGTNLQRDESFQTDREGNQVFKGHRNLVTCLSVSMDGTLLLSGSHDETVRLWDIQSKQCVRTVNHKGSVTNAFIMPAPANMFQPDSRPTVGLPRFSRHLNPSEPGEGGESGGVSLRLGLHMQGTEDSYLEKAGKLHELMCAATDKSVFGIGENTKVRVAELEDEVKKLKKINKDLYEFSTQILTKPH